MGYACKLGGTSSGKLNIVELGTATSYNIGTLYPSVAPKVTIDNFFYRLNPKEYGNQFLATGSIGTVSTGIWTQTSSDIIFYYDQSTYILTSNNHNVLVHAYQANMYIESPSTSYMFYV